MQIPIRTDSPEQAPIPVPDRPNGRHRKERKEGEDGGLSCDYFPEILACQETGKPSDRMFHDISIPQVTDDKTWSSHNFLPLTTAYVSAAENLSCFRQAISGKL
ncbi:IgG-binding virulence factor TspB family protein [Neisseria gonorrhoeae]|nr:IgG-binding virulence factor TspB family protein [Neisseria gonorrhoeae]UYA81423.1 IgG-binding virulence factor TspB family protein [Neisseria gonorrhoeae]